MTVELDYGAITLDTSVFDGNGLNLERGLLKQLEQFSSSPVKFVISDVVLREVRNHLIEAARSTRQKIEDALRSARTIYGIDDEIAARTLHDLTGGRTDEEVVERRIASFTQRTGALVVLTGSVNVSTLTDLYFEVSPPFEAGRDKKAEFPDAIALLSLEAWAEENDVKVLAVSRDKGWSRFCEQSTSLDGQDDLAKALAHFQPHNASRDIVDALRDLLTKGGEHEILDHVSDMIVEMTNDAEIDIEHYSAIHAELDQVEAHYRSHEYLQDQAEKPIVDLIRIEDRWLVLRLRVRINYDVQAWFNMSVWDSIDREYVSIGGSKLKRSDSVDADFLLSLTADFSNGLKGVKVGEMEMDVDFPRVDFGEVEPQTHDE